MDLQHSELLAVALTEHAERAAGDPTAAFKFPAFSYETMLQAELGMKGDAVHSKGFISVLFRGDDMASLCDLYNLYPAAFLGKDKVAVDNPPTFDEFIEKKAVAHARAYLEKYGTSKHYRGMVNERSAPRQASLPIKYLDRVIAIAQGKSDFYITQGKFFCHSRKAKFYAGTHCLWLDLDVYSKPSGFHFDFAENETHIVATIKRICDRHGIPHPSLICRTGRGYNCRWLTHFQPSYMWPHTKSVMTYLLKAFAELGADHKCVDQSRIFRVIGSVNSKNGETVRLLDFNPRAEYDISDVGNGVLPVKRTPEARAERDAGWAMVKTVNLQLREERSARKKTEKQWLKEKWGGRTMADVRANGNVSREKKLPRTKKLIGQAIWAPRIPDLEKLIAGTRGQKSGCREILMMFRTVAGLQVGEINAENFDDSVIDIAAQFPYQVDLDDPVCSLSTLRGMAVKAAGSVDAGEKIFYKYSTEKIIEVLEITEKEMLELNLAVLISPEIGKERRKQRAEAKRRVAGVIPRKDFLDGAKDRAQRASDLYATGLTWAKVGEVFGLNEDAARMLAKRAMKAAQKGIEVAGALLGNLVASVRRCNMGNETEHVINTVLVVERGLSLHLKGKISCLGKITGLPSLAFSQSRVFGGNYCSANLVLGESNRLAQFNYLANTLSRKIQYGFSRPVSLGLGLGKIAALTTGNSGKSGAGDSKVVTAPASCSVTIVDSDGAGLASSMPAGP